MKYVLPVIAAAVSLLSSASAQAADVWQFDNLGFTLVDRGYTSDHVPSSVSLISQSATQTVVSLGGLATASALYPAIDNGPDSQPSSRWNGDFDRYRVAVGDGYRVTGITIEVTYSGELHRGTGGTVGSGGWADNRMSFGIGVGEPGESQHYSQTIASLDGTQVKVTNTGALSLTGDFGLQAETFIETSAEAARDRFGRLVEGSYANIQAESIQLTFHMAPVPEPETYVMLGAGLALLVGVARRRQRKERQG